MRPTSRRSCVCFVSHMFLHCDEMHLHCFLLSVAWFQEALISSDCFESFFNRLSMARSFAGGSSMENALNLRLSTESRDHSQWCSGYCEVGSTRRHRVQIPLTTFFFPSSFFFLFLFCFVCLFVLLVFFVLFFFVFKYIRK